MNAQHPPIATLRRTDPADPNPDDLHCVGCGGFHGSIGAQIHCLRAAVRNLRAALRERSAPVR